MKKFSAVMDILGPTFMLLAGFVWIITGFIYDGPDPDVASLWVGGGLLWVIIAVMNFSANSQTKMLQAERALNNVRWELAAERLNYLESEVIKARRRTSLLG